MPWEPSDFVIFEGPPVTPVTPAKKPQKTEGVKPKDDIDIETLQNHIKDLHEQTTISNRDLIKLHEFINQPLLDKNTLRETVTENTYKAARQKIAVRYAMNELKSIRDVVLYIGTQISNADLRLVKFKDSLGPRGTTSRSLGERHPFKKLSEMMLELWDLHASVLELDNICEFALEHETVVSTIAGSY